MAEMIHVSGGPTKPEIISIVISKLELNEGDSFFDVGCGTGAVSIQAGSLVKNLSITAIDAREKAIDTARKNFKAFKTPGVNLILGESSQIIAQADKVDCAFIGGSKNIIEVLNVLVVKKTRKIVVNAVRLETTVKVIQRMKELEIFHEVIHVSVSRGIDLMGETMFKPENAVFIIVGGREKIN